MIQIIPAIDLIEGKCVRLTQGDYGQKKIYNENPLEVALEFEDAGLKRLHLVDLDGAKAKKVVNWKVLEKIASKTSLHVDFGGGVQSDDDLKIAFESGAKQVTGGSIAVKQPDLFEHFLQTGLRRMKLIRRRIVRQVPKHADTYFHESFKKGFALVRHFGVRKFLIRIIAQALFLYIDLLLKSNEPGRQTHLWQYLRLPCFSFCSLYLSQMHSVRDRRQRRPPKLL